MPRKKKQKEPVETIDYDPMDLARLVRGWRKDRGLTQLQLANAAGVSRTTVANVEQAAYADVAFSTVVRISRALKVPLVVLMAFYDMHSTR